MLGFALALAKKDLTLTLFRGAGLVQSLLLGLLLFFLFSLSRQAGELVPAQTAATIFWLSSVFCQVLIFNTVFSYEEATKSRRGLLLLPYPAAGIWMGKALAGLALLFLCQLLFFPAAVVFLGQGLNGDALSGIAGLLLVDVGLASLGALLGALAQGQAAKESLLSLLVFPLLVPLLLAGIALLAELFDPSGNDVASWTSFAAAFDAVFIATSLLLFRFIYGDD